MIWFVLDYFRNYWLVPPKEDMSYFIFKKWKFPGFKFLVFFTLAAKKGANFWEYRQQKWKMGKIYGNSHVFCTLAEKRGDFVSGISTAKIRTKFGNPMSSLGGVLLISVNFWNDPLKVHGVPNVIISNYDTIFDIWYLYLEYYQRIKKTDTNISGK